jgi:hypothetical protein
MNTAVAGPVRWSVRRWIYTLAAVFALQAGLLLYFGQRELPLPARPPFRTAVHFVFDPWSSEQLDRLPAMIDPTLFALPGDSGFSGAAWLRGAPLAYQPEHWSEPFRWLALDEPALGGDFARFVATNFIAPPLVADQPAPPLLRYEPHFSNDPLRQQSRLRLEGELTSRPLLTPLELRSWPHSDILSNTIVRAAIDADGLPLFPALIGECGLPLADLHALKLAAAARFRPLPRAGRDPTGLGPLAWGKLIFEWHTLPLTATNPPTGQP